MDKILSRWALCIRRLEKSRKPAYKRVLCFKWGNRDIESHPGINIGIEGPREPFIRQNSTRNPVVILLHLED